MTFYPVERMNTDQLFYLRAFGDLINTLHACTKRKSTFVLLIGERFQQNAKPGSNMLINFFYKEASRHINCRRRNLKCHAGNFLVSD
jgi:hypothetical protein